MRSTLGDAIVELSLKPLRSLLETLLAQEFLPPQSEVDTARSGLARGIAEVHAKTTGR